VNSIQSEEDAPFDSLSGFVGGDFSAGKVKDIKLPSGCWVMAFSERADILAAGMKNRVDFLETQNYSTIYSLSFSDKISAIQWCRGSDLCATTGKKLDDGSDREIVAVAGLDGHVAVYRLNVSLLELQGVHLLYDFHVHSQVRCMAMKPLGDGNVVLAVGDKRGRITLTTLMHAADGQVTSTYPAVVDLQKDAVLGLDIHPERSILAASTKSGKVIVFQLIMTKFQIEKSYVICGSRLWKTQQNGPVRAVVISKDGKQLAFGGYDKTLVLVDTNLYAIVRELTLHGTVRI
jgi:WD40 repeat protein